MKVLTEEPPLEVRLPLMVQLGYKRPHTLTTSFGPSDVVPALTAFWRRRDLLWHMTIRHLRGQYKQSVLGFAWMFVNPLSLIVILTFVFSTIMRVSSNGTPYPLFLFVALIPWIFFSSALASATDSVVGAASLVTKVYFPREILPTAAVLTKIVDFGAGLLILAGVMIYYSTLPAWTVWWFPILFTLHVVFTLGICYPLSALNLYFHDVRFLVGVALNLWFYLTPIIYPLDIVPDKYRIFFELNPNSLFINAYRRVILYGESPGLDRVALGLGITVVTFVVGYYLFKRMEPGFADRI